MWQWQYAWNLPEGFHAWFTKDGKDFEIITHNKRIQESMIESKLYKFQK